MKNIVAIYTRLSEEDRNKLSQEDDSQSIQNQKSMLISYAVQNGWEIFNIYSDDDYKGSDRQRPAFNQLLKDAHEKKFNIVLCKTQSRFTRELELVEKIIHGDFIELGIRFIGLADNADTSVPGNKKARQINGLVNEWYLEDLSDNIKSVLADHQIKGLHTGSFAPYGYKKDPEQKGHLIIDPEAAEIVREIFDKAATGMGRTSIARSLNRREIPNPTEYKRLHGENYKCGVGKNNSTLWRYYTISHILKNQMYIGDMVQHRYENPSYKSKHSRPVPKEQWRIVKNTHEPIISLDTWNIVQRRIEENYKPVCTGSIGIYAGKVRCKYCGYQMSTHISKKIYYLRCSTRYTDKSSCQGSFIAYRFLSDIILKELRQIIDAYFCEAEVENRLTLKNDYQEKKARLNREIRIYNKKIADLKDAVKNTYLDKSKGIISEQDYLELRAAFQKDIEEYEQKIADCNILIEKAEEALSQSRTKRDILMEYRDVTELSRPIMEHLIDYIEVGKGQKRATAKNPPPVVIHWKI